ncbi:MAG: folylpolyglutamate synthase/dihydrofolate synthase family protein [Gammaproteobacteria bacterium]|jgi:dihydrofolate synthase/folylpolyglutamate synthase|nr:bifunctional folylpolyglutamate synthase/dihydrofolate synthase [Chromatiales bacterium]MDP7154656.1 folylpolyglutamate synthase/dihydrofolate synthase family protein [Gammaproteobacteria bacterium]
MQRSLSDWLAWQAGLNPHEIELGLERVRRVIDRLPLNRPASGVFAVAGTNGKGSTVSFIEQLCRANGLETAAYTSPHLIRYNERMRLNGNEVSDEWLIEQFEVVDAARGAIPLTYFEFGTLAALHGFSQARADTWILEIGLGGRLDAVNAIDPDFSLVTTIALEHQEWLGDTIDAIAAEKAGILRRGRPAFYGDEPVPDGFRQVAKQIGARVSCLGVDFACLAGQGGSWTWQGSKTQLVGLPSPAPADPVQRRNASLALAAVEALDPALLNRPAVERALAASPPPARFQVIDRDRQWIVDVAHNPQAAGNLRRKLLDLDAHGPLTVVIGLLEDKQVDGFIAQLADLADRWLVCSVDVARGHDVQELAALIQRAGGRNVTTAGTPEQGFAAARAISRPGERILVTGSFHIAGPALCWLGLY